MGNGAVKCRQLAAKAKKRARQNSSVPSVVMPTATAASPPASPPPSPHTVADAIPEADVGMDAITLEKKDKKLTTKERKGHRIPTSDRVTRFRVVANNSSPFTGDATEESSQAEVAPKQSQPHETLPSGASEQRLVRQSSIPIRTLLQQISSETNVEEDSAAISSGEDEGKSDLNNSEDNEKNYVNRNNDNNNNNNDDESIEIVAPKKVAASKARKKPAQVITVQADESKSEDSDGNGESDTSL
jgi:hypothetical protein